MPLKLSVIIPCYNERATIASVLAAVRACPVPDLQIIVVDDGSTDGTRELLQGELRKTADPCCGTSAIRARVPPCGPGWRRQRAI